MTIASTPQGIWFPYSCRPPWCFVHSAWFCCPTSSIRPFCSAAFFLSVAGPLSVLNATVSLRCPGAGLTSGAVNGAVILFANHAGHKKEAMADIPGLAFASLLSGGVCLGLFLLLLAGVDLHTPGGAWAPSPIGDDATVRIGLHLFT